MVTWRTSAKMMLLWLCVVVEPLAVIGPLKMVRVVVAESKNFQSMGKKFWRAMSNAARVESLAATLEFFRIRFCFVVLVYRDGKVQISYF